MVTTKYKELWGFFEYVIFPVKILQTFLLGTVLNKSSELQNIIGIATLDSEKLDLTEEITLDLLCRANIESSVMNSSPKTILMCVVVDILTSLFFIMMSYYFLSMLLWVFVINFPISFALLIVLMTNFSSFTSIFVNLALNLERLVLGGIFQKMRYKSIISDKEIRKNVRKSIKDGSSFFTVGTLYRSELVTGEYERAINKIVEVSRQNPSPPIETFKAIYEFYFSLKNKLDVIEFLDNYDFNLEIK